MIEIPRLVKRLEFSSMPADWSIASVSTDWRGDPLVLFKEGKPLSPVPGVDFEAIGAWLNHPPKRHHLVYWEGSSQCSVSFENPEELLTTVHIQQHPDGWLLGESRNGLTRIFDKAGQQRGSLKLGDASEHIRTSPDGHIWVGYFDEGVVGGGIGQAGLVCFDLTGKPVFDYADFARENMLPFIYDCYALNVTESETWVCYYSDFPLVCIKDFKLKNSINDFGSTTAFAVRENEVISLSAYRSRLRAHNLKTAVVQELDFLLPESSSTDEVATNQKRPAGVGSGPRMFIYDEHALYELL